MTLLATSLVDLTPLITQVVGVVGAALLAIGTFAIHKFNVWISAKTGHQNLVNEDVVRGYLSTALDNATHFAVGKVGSADWSKIDTKNALVNEALNYATAHVPDAIAYFKLDTAGVTALIESRLTKLFPDATTVSK